MKRLNKAQKKKIKESLLKLLHVTCYILSGLFIIMMVFVCVNSCHQRKISGVSAEVGIQNLTGTSWRFNDVIGLGDGFDYYITFQDNNDVNYVRLHANTSELYYYYGSTMSQSNQVYDGYEDYGWYDDDYKIIYINGGNDVSNPLLINWLYQNASIRNDVSSFVFNRQFNFNAPINLSLNDFYGGDLSQAQQMGGDAGTVWRITYTFGNFYSNGMVFDGVCVDFTRSTSNVYLVDSILRKGTNERALSYISMSYRLASNGSLVMVNQRETGQRVDTNNIMNLGTNNLVTYQLNSSVWINDSFRYLTIYNTLTDTTRIKLNAFNNNNQNSVSGYIGANDGTNVFNLISQAFQAWIPILSLTILPSITIGMLVFLPLVVTLIFVIIRIIKK